jgi:DNA-binding NtrC family response regulator
MGNPHERAQNLPTFDSAAQRGSIRGAEPAPTGFRRPEDRMKEKLLVLDDELPILKSLQELFEEDYKVYATNDAEQALLLAAEHDIAVILCDESMPCIPGHEFLRRVREISNAARVLMSEFADFTALTEAVNSGQIFSYIAKPWEAAKLKARIKAAATHFKLVQEAE